MRQARPDFQPGATYLITSRMAGRRSFGSEEIAAFRELLHKLDRLYPIDLLEVGFLTNAYYLRIRTPAEPATLEETRQCCRDFFADDDQELTEQVIRDWQPRLHDPAWFMRDLQQRFSVWYNRSRTTRRKGSLWADRYRSIQLTDL